MTHSITPMPPSAPPLSEETAQPVLLVPGTTTKVTLDEWVKTLVHMLDAYAMTADEDVADEVNEAVLFLASLPESLQSPPGHQTLPETSSGDDYAIALQRIIETICHGHQLPVDAILSAPHHAAMAAEYVTRRALSTAPQSATT